LREEQILKLVEQEVKGMGLVIDPETNLYLKEIMEKGEIIGIKKALRNCISRKNSLQKK